MKELRFHGRRLPRYDHTAPFVDAARLLATAALHEGKQVQFRPPWLFLRGYVPEAAHLRVATEPIESTSQEYVLDLVAVTDASILTAVDVTAGLKETGVVLVNGRSPVSLKGRARTAVADLDAIARRFATDLALPMAAATAALLGVMTQKALAAVVRAETSGRARQQALRALEAAAQAVAESRR
ncbi:MAG: pyruvate:ferredoxin oxidoreductase subunit gamma, pyruvate ferredoxin oxidoreductase, gamma subunit [candidate division NC10 bacterium CSP1-5]|nr:MAG: pyruvate:ferredoxin oxidoreductase subunit gamma, pyruvate ferredoxin oxidoreductase, gamma subunit [candidate division NC10 bacterium CSP1-5]